MSNLFEGVRAQVEGKDKASKTPKKQDDTFEVTVQCVDGQKRTGQCTVHIPTTEERIEVGRILNRLAGGIPWSSLDPDAKTLINAVVTIGTMLKDIPDWLSKEMDYDQALVFQIYEYLLQYDIEFFRRDGLPGTEDRGDPQGDREPQIVRFRRTSEESRAVCPLADDAGRVDDQADDVAPESVDQILADHRAGK